MTLTDLFKSLLGILLLMLALFACLFLAGAGRPAGGPQPRSGPGHKKGPALQT